LNNKKWIISRRIKDFLELHHILKLMFVDVEIPECKIFKLEIINSSGIGDVNVSNNYNIKEQ
jgi:hypothetical protein